MENNLKFIGIDVSKLTLDICVITSTTKFYEISNTQKDIQKFFLKELDSAGSAHVCIENTGKYSWELMRSLPGLDCMFYVVNPLHLKRSIGLVRGKNDQVDAERIAGFIKKNHAETKPFTVRRDEIETIQVLLSERSIRIGQKSQLATKSKELSTLNNPKLAKLIQTKNNRIVKELNKQIKELEALIKQIIENDSQLMLLNKQLKSIPGVGDILAWNMIVKTNEFKTITEPRKMACYTGVAPFSCSSGTSVFGKPRVSLLADKKLKKILHLGAMSAIRFNNDLAVYYHRKVEEGKNKMSVLNAVRNKIIHLIFALIKNQTFYENRLAVS